MPQAVVLMGSRLTDRFPHPRVDRSATGSLRYGHLWITRNGGASWSRVTVTS